MAVHSFLHYALTVPDLSVGQNFYTDFGFTDMTGQSNTVRLRPATVDRDQVLLYEGRRKRLHHLAFGASGEEYERVRAKLRAAGVTELDAPTDDTAGGIWFRDPDGNLVNVRDEAAPKIPIEPVTLFNGPGNPQRIGDRAVNPPFPDRARPRRLGHVMMFSPQLEKQRAFYTDVLGMLVSDDVSGIVTFLRCTSDHHNLAFLRSSHPGFHHGSFEVGDVDEIAMGAVRMQDRGWQPGWGLGRHCIGSNFFFYMKDPWGSYAEYFFDIDHIPEGYAWQPRDWDPSLALYAWGPDVPRDFEVNKEE
jgi:catechol 2,3-dioxygenase-like lactoylglutathione lyase family enzyme